MLAPFLVFIGGGLGALCRYLLSLLLAQSKFPLATITCNLLGCLLIGLLASLIPKGSPSYLCLITGLLGGFTTYSSFSLDSLRLLQDGHFFQVALYLILSLLGGLLLAWLGFILASSSD